MPLKAKCECDGIEDCWNQSTESHYTKTIHEPDCPVGGDDARDDAEAAYEEHCDAQREEREREDREGFWERGDDGF